MDLDPLMALAGVFVGFTVGLTGMGGGALMTPILVLLFNVEPLAAVSSDLVASFVMKPIGAGVHLRRGTVNLRLVAWLVVGSVPSAFAGVLILGALGDGQTLQDLIKKMLGAALLVAATTIVLKSLLAGRRHDADLDASDITIKPALTVMIGVLGGLVVGLTSVGSGSLMIVALLLVYPGLRASQLVGTDLVQAIPLVGSAALGHLLFGDFQLGLTTSLLIGALPGVYAGARLSAKAPDHVIRPALVVVLTASALKLLGVSTAVIGVLLVLAAIGATAVVLRRRRRTTAKVASAP